MKILIDTNVVLDLLLNRPKSDLAEQILTQIVYGRFIGCVSASAITDIYYIVRKALGNPTQALNAIGTLLINLEIADTTSDCIYQAIDLNWPDFEDAVQYTSGQGVLIDIIVTNNVTDFKQSIIPVMTPQDFINQFIQS